MSEVCIHTIREVFVYKIPPLKTTQGHRASDWNLGAPALTGVLKVLTRVDESTKEETTVIAVYHEAKNGDRKQFAACPIALSKDKTLEFFVEAVRDSSRYFVIRCSDPKSGRHAYIGIGFRDRQVAFDFRATLQDELKRQQREREATALQTKRDAEDARKPKKDWSLKQGQTIKISIGGAKAKSKANTAGGSAAEDAFENEDWGDFQSS